MSNPTSPVSARHRRHPSSLDFSSSANSFNENVYYSPQTPRSPRPFSPATPRQRNSQLLNGDRRMSEDYIEPVDSGGGLGNLADELADAWAEEEGYEDASGIEVNSQAETISGNHTEDSVAHEASVPQGGLSPEHPSNLQPPRNRARQTQNRHRRTDSQYDGSDYGNDSDLDEAEDISPSLESRMAGIESLVRRGTEDNGSANDQVIKRLVDSLRDLGPQSGIENGAARLITAHTSITSHLTHQTRALQTLIHPLLFSHFPLLTTEAIDELVPLIDEGLLPNLPFPLQPSSQTAQQGSSIRPASAASTISSYSQPADSNPLTSMQSLLHQTSDLTLALRTLNDTLHESRQLTSTASRRLRSARELVADLKREDEDREEGHRWIERGQWDRKLKEREAGRVCGEVVSGFEAVCGEWRRKLFGGAVAASNNAPGPEVAAA